MRRGAGLGRKRRLRLAGATATGALALAMTRADAAAPDLGRIITHEPGAAFAAATVVGLAVFAVTTAVFYVRERSRWEAREAGLAARLDEAVIKLQQAELFAGADDQIVVTWANPAAEARIEGAIPALGIGGRISPLAFSQWADLADVKRLGDAVDLLKARGQPFDLSVSSRSGHHIEARGRVTAGRAMLHLRDISPTQRALIAAERERDDLRRTTAQMAAVLDNGPGLAWTRGPDGALTWVNAAYAAAVEAASPADAVARGTELLDRDERERAARARGDVTAFNATAPAVAAGKRLMFQLHEAPVEGGSAGYATDITALEDLRADLRRQMDAHVRVLDRLPTAIAVFDARQHLAYRNRAYETIWALDAGWLDGGPTDGEILDRLRTERRLPEAVAYKEWKANRLKAYTAVETAEDWWHLPDGRTVHVATAPNPQGGVIQIFDDATERFSLESRVNALAQAQRETLDGLREGVAVFGSDGRLRLSNPAFAGLWKLSPAMLETRPHVDEVLALCRHVAPCEAEWAAIRAAIVGVRDRGGQDHAARMTRLDGSVLDCALAPLPDGATLLTFADVTDNVNVEIALTERNAALEKAARLRDDFVHHVSYALRSPLTAIIGFAQLIGEEIAGPLNPRQREYAQLILRSSGTLLTIINDILDLASLDNNELTLDLERTDVEELVTSAARGLEDQLAETGITLTREIAPDAASLTCDARRMRQALYNLLSNAIGFSQKGQAVSVKVRREGADTVFEVTDHGRGIPDAVKDRIFDRFESHTSGSRHRGVGLGLAIVRSFVSLHGGSVEISSHPGQGTVARCRIPDQPDQRPDKAA
jgi:signal transduction histidine kinase